MGVGALMQKAVFLDRDGVLNQAVIKNGKPYPPETVQQVIIPNEVESALQILKQLGYLLIVVTNQPDVARGLTSKTSVQAINEFLRQRLPLDDFRICYHDDKDHCHCRKPQPGLLQDAARDHGIALEQSFLIGDRWKDIAAGQAAGCKTIFIDQGYREAQPNHPNFTTRSLLQGAQWIKEFRENKYEDSQSIKN